MHLRNEKGVVLALSIMVVAVLLVLGTTFMLRSIAEKNSSDRERSSAKAFYLAEAGCEEALGQIDTLINTDLMTTVNQTTPQVVAQDAQSYVDAGNGLGLLVDYTKHDGEPQFTLEGTNAVYEHPIAFLAAGTYKYRIVIEEKEDPSALTGNQTWQFPYFYIIESKGTVDGVVKRATISGDFTVQVQRDNFAKFALFTNRHETPEGTNVWFTDKTHFAGPVHTNTRYNFAFNPGSQFEGPVSQVYDTARFYNSGSPVLMDADENPPEDVPQFDEGFTRGADEITLDSSVEKQDLIDQAQGTETHSENGIFVANDGMNLTGGIYINGDSTINMGVDADNNAVYTITQGGVTKIITPDITTNETTIETVGIGQQTFHGLPDGIDDVGTIIFDNGAITSLGGTIQEDTELTIASENDVVITDNIMYSDFTPAVGIPGDADYVPPSAEGATNLLGIVSWSGDVRIGTTAPDNINIHGSIMARGENGVFTVDNYNNTTVGSRGVATLLGGVITQNYGAFGLFSGRTGQQISGYGRNFVYDSRTLTGKSPPYYPSMRTFIAFTNDITDKLAWGEGGFSW